MVHRFWKVALALALVLPMVAFVVGSLMASAADDPAPRAPIRIDAPQSPSSSRAPSAVPVPAPSEPAVPAPTTPPATPAPPGGAAPTTEAPRSPHPSPSPVSVSPSPADDEPGDDRPGRGGGDDRAERSGRDGGDDKVETIRPKPERVDDNRTAPPTDAGAEVGDGDGEEDEGDGDDDAGDVD